jgi:transglutaminase-like putative cysteine protease
VGVFTVIKPHTELVIDSTLDVVITPIQFPMDEEPAEQQWQFLAEHRYEAEFMDFLDPHTSPLHQEIRAALYDVVNGHDKPLKNALALFEYVYANLPYEQGVTSVETPPKKSGS